MRSSSRSKAISWLARSNSAFKRTRLFELPAVQPHVWIVVYWAREMTCSTADRICFFQPIRSGILPISCFLDRLPSRDVEAIMTCSDHMGCIAAPVGQKNAGPRHWGVFNSGVRSAVRAVNPPDYRCGSLVFRLARTYNLFP